MAPGSSLRIFSRVRRAKVATSGSYLSKKDSSWPSTSACDGFALDFFRLRTSDLGLRMSVPLNCMSIAAPADAGGSAASHRTKPILLFHPLVFRPLIYPVIHCFVPELRILRLQHPVPFIRKVEHL